MLSLIATLFGTLLLYATLAVIVLLIIRLIIPPSSLQYGTGSILYKIGRASDFLVMPIHHRMPPGTHAAVPALLAIFVVIVIAYFIGSIFNDVLIRGIGGFVLSLGRGSIIPAIGFLLYGAISVYITLLILRIIFSWVRIGYMSGGRVTRFVYEVTEPALSIFRGIIPPISGIDLSPILLFFLLQIVKRAVWTLFIRG